ncbi:MAG: hypothetical protein AB1468_01490 [Candidatus Micrarchaeota archaeon]
MANEVKARLRSAQLYNDAADGEYRRSDVIADMLRRIASGECAKVLKTLNEKIDAETNYERLYDIINTIQSLVLKYPKLIPIEFLETAREKIDGSIDKFERGEKDDV